MRFPELMWLHKYELAPAMALALLCFILAGWAGLVVGFFWSTVLVYHATFCINSLAHVHGTKRYVTGDDSRNSWLLAFITMGEGWHNNHHAYPSSVRRRSAALHVYSQSEVPSTIDLRNRLDAEIGDQFAATS